MAEGLYHLKKSDLVGVYGVPPHTINTQTENI